jgi:hypothetical protein
MDDILERQRLQRKKRGQKFGAADFKFSSDVSLVLDACLITCMSSLFSNDTK